MLPPYLLAPEAQLAPAATRAIRRDRTARSGTLGPPVDPLAHFQNDRRGPGGCRRTPASRCNRCVDRTAPPDPRGRPRGSTSGPPHRSEEHTSELQSQSNLVCRLLLEKKK